MRVHTTTEIKIAFLNNLKNFSYKSFQETIDLAESLGWVDTYGDAEEGKWGPRDCDDCEQEALDYIQSIQR